MPLPAMVVLALATANKSFEASSADQAGNVRAAAPATASNVVSAMHGDFVAATQSLSKSVGGSASKLVRALPTKWLQVLNSSLSMPISPRPATMTVTTLKGADCKTRPRQPATASRHKPPLTIASNASATAAGSASWNKPREMSAKRSAMDFEAGNAATTDRKSGKTVSSGCPSRRRATSFPSLSPQVRQFKGMWQRVVKTESGTFSPTPSYRILSATKSPNSLAVSSRLSATFGSG
mmetsp:Transcript_49918/g.99053  ORF Transcript_49918/g.99053 Transcript_49918/m.99053 type:complete len:237 (-) Transcript_49918:1345-2055(-)